MTPGSFLWLYILYTYTYSFPLPPQGHHRTSEGHADMTCEAMGRH